MISVSPIFASKWLALAAVPFLFSEYFNSINNTHQQVIEVHDSAKSVKIIKGEYTINIGFENIDTNTILIKLVLQLKTKSKYFF